MLLPRGTAQERATLCSVLGMQEAGVQGTVPQVGPCTQHKAATWHSALLPSAEGRLLQLDERKRQAVVREDYDEAKALKTKLDRLKSFGQRIAELEAR